MRCEKCGYRRALVDSDTPTPCPNCALNNKLPLASDAPQDDVSSGSACLRCGGEASVTKTLYCEDCWTTLLEPPLAKPRADIYTGCRCGRCGYVFDNYEELLRHERSVHGDKPDADLVNHPKHYTSHPSGIECITITEHMTFNLGNAVKYIWRADLKSDKVEDLRKARWYLDREIARLEK